jgi:hypothetical protein
LQQRLAAILPSRQDSPRREQAQLHKIDRCMRSFSCVLCIGEAWVSSGDVLLTQAPAADKPKSTMDGSDDEMPNLRHCPATNEAQGYRS